MRKNKVFLEVKNCAYCTSAICCYLKISIDNAQGFLYNTDVTSEQLNMNIPYHSWAAKRSRPTQ